LLTIIKDSFYLDNNTAIKSGQEIKPILVIKVVLSGGECARFKLEVEYGKNSKPGYAEKREGAIGAEAYR
jgi:hypothetical protein